MLSACIRARTGGSSDRRASTNSLRVVMGATAGRWRHTKTTLEAAVDLVLPLLGWAAGAHHQAAFQVSPDDQPFHQQPGHYRLTRTGVVGQEEPERLAGQH